MGQTLGEQNSEPGSSRETQNLFPLEIKILGVEDGGSSSPLISTAPLRRRPWCASPRAPLLSAWPVSGGRQRPQQQLDVRRSPARGARGREGLREEGGAESARGLGQCGGWAG